MSDKTQTAGRIVGIDHVQLAMPPGEGCVFDALHFYGELLGLREVPKPAGLGGRGGLWFAGPSTAIHLGVVQHGFVPARKAHPALLVADLAALTARLAQGGVDAARDDAIPGVRRAYTHDPFGNRIELIELADGGFTERR